MSDYATNGGSVNGGTSLGTTNGEAPTVVPPTDIFETNDAVIMLLDMPGADPDSLNVTLEKRGLMVTAQAKSSVPAGYASVQQEYRDGNYERAFMLPDPVDGDRIEALFKDGVLRLTLPKAGPAQVKKITVKSA
jgi:HSP20 family protein